MGMNNKTHIMYTGYQVTCTVMKCGRITRREMAYRWGSGRQVGKDPAWHVWLRRTSLNLQGKCRQAGRRSCTMKNKRMRRL